MDRIIKLFQAVGVAVLAAAILTGYSAVREVSAQLPCDDDPYCHSDVLGDRLDGDGCNSVVCQSDRMICCLSWD